MLSFFENKDQLFKFYKIFSEEYSNRFKLYKHYLEYVKGSTILNQTILKLSTKKIEKLIACITRDEITLRIMHFLENTKFTISICKTSKNKYFLSFDEENFLKSSLKIIKEKILKSVSSRFLKEYDFIFYIYPSDY